MRHIPLSNGKVVLVDDEDFLRFGSFRWSMFGRYVGRRTSRACGQKRTLVLLHREISQPGAGEQVDHISGDTLDNRRCNLRNCTAGENSRNRKSKSRATTPYKGVWFDRRCGRWVVYIRKDHAVIWVGSFATDVEAAHAYDAAAIKHHGAFARINFPVAA